MLTRPAGHEAEARKSEAEAEAQKNFEAEATMYEAEARHITEQLSVYEHEDIGVHNIVFSKRPIHSRNDCRWLYREYLLMSFAL